MNCVTDIEASTDAAVFDVTRTFQPFTRRILRFSPPRIRLSPAATGVLSASRVAVAPLNRSTVTRIPAPVMFAHTIAETIAPDAPGGVYPPMAVAPVPTA